ncbi:MAG TPA: DUF1223 domain-containing protein [Candidatus Acidoferrum sp.]|nr:DUF1223 domain-containing protein [Candidatus Acidoferrum sp.]
MNALFSKLPAVGTAALIAVLSGVAAFHSQENAKPFASQTSPVVVELFTSEGCSSCPPADAFLAKLAEQGPGHNLQIVALEEHVDYWDDQGWRDPFSSHNWTTRQDAYAGVLGNKNPYTPQIVVDGSVECSGGRPQLALQDIVQASAQAKTSVTLSQAPAGKPGTEDFSVQIGKLKASPKGGSAEVWLAITETGLHSSVTRGENAGHELSHAAVVRSMRKVGEAKPDRDVAFSGDASIQIRREWKFENLKAVALVQEKNSMRILGAAEIPLHP